MPILTGCSQHHPPLPDVDPSTAEVFRAFRRFMQLQRLLKMKTMSVDAGSHGEAFCLRILAEGDGRSQHELAAMLHLSRPRVTKLLQALEEAGDVVRRSDAEDRRLTRVYLTDAGRERERRLHAIWADQMDQTIGTLSEDERRVLARLLDKISDSTQDVLDHSEEGEE